jgi:hypothetical protein
VSIAVDAPVAPDTALFRRLSMGLDIVRDEDRDCLRLSSAAFKTKNQRLSVVIEDTLLDEGRKALNSLDNYPDDYLVSITAATAVERDREIERTPEANEKAHAEIVGKVTNGDARKLCREAQWLKAPPGLCPEEEAKIVPS